MDGFRDVVCDVIGGGFLYIGRSPARHSLPVSSSVLSLFCFRFQSSAGSDVDIGGDDGDDAEGVLLSGQLRGLSVVYITLLSVSSSLPLLCPAGVFFMSMFFVEN